MELTVIEIARRSAGMSQAELALMADTTQSAVSDYERRRKSPTLAVAERLLAAAGSDLMVIPLVTFERHESPDGGSFQVPNRLWPLLPPLCFDRVRIPACACHEAREVWDLSDRTQRLGVYVRVLCHGTSEVILTCVDGALLIETWPDLDLPDGVRKAWQHQVDAARGRANRRGGVRVAGDFSHHPDT